jgi:formamidopyrimidine-DNA glycosylase
MPELPDVTVYVESLEKRLVGRVLDRVSLKSPFFLRTFDHPIEVIEGQEVLGVRRIGKRIVFEFDDELFLVFHLMVAGRFRWKDQAKAKLGGKIVLATFKFPNGSLFVTEASKKKRASLHLVKGEDALSEMNPGGLEVLEASIDQFAERLRLRNHTLKRALSDPKLFSGIGNAYSDEILNVVGLSPLALSQKLSDEDVAALFDGTKKVLSDWTDRLRNDFADRFPGAGEITAFRPDFSVHGQYGNPCKRCGTTVQRIRYAENETNYCPNCQTGGKILSDRSLARLLKDDWPKTVEELEYGN